MNKKLRIACYGRIDKNNCSSIVAGYHAVEELLNRGHEIDYYGEKDYMYPEELFKYQNFNHIEVLLQYPVAIIKNFLSNSHYLKTQFLPALNALVFNRYICQDTKRKIIANHQRRKYDLLFFPQLYSPFNVNGIPVVSWVPDPTDTEWYFVRKHRKSVIELCGTSLYLKKKAFCALKNNQRRSDLKRHSDVVICGSQWSKEQHLTALKFEPEMIKSIPYPVETNVFRLKPIDKAKPNLEKVFLWLGRIEPRKRLDLLLDAYSLILQERQDIKLKIIGSVKSEFADYQKLLKCYKFRHLVDYQPAIERSKVPELLTQCDVLIQPSEGENFGTSVAEALCCGLPVIVGQTNGTKDFISPSSFVFEEYTPGSVKKAMLQAIEAIEHDQEKIALESRKTAEENFSISKVVDRLEDIFFESVESYQLKSLKLSEYTV